MSRRSVLDHSRRPLAPSINGARWTGGSLLLLLMGITASCRPSALDDGPENTVRTTSSDSKPEVEPPVVAVETSAASLQPESHLEPQSGPQPLSTVPGLADRTGHAPLADLFAKADPAADAQWSSEQFSAVAGGQLKALAKLTDQLDTLTTDSLSPFIADDYRGPPLRPLTDEIFRDGALVVRRQRAESQDDLVGQAGFIEGFRQLLSLYAGGDDHHLHVKFKIVRAKLADDRAETTAYVEIYGSSDDFPDRQAQQTATWRCQWIRQPGGDLPLLQNVVVSDYEEVLPASERTGAFVDNTIALLGANASFTDQLVYGADHWYGNFDVAFGIHQGNQGLALGDANGDGREDLFLCQPTGLPNRLYIQQPDGTLLDQTRESGLDWLDTSRSALFVDLDNDGDQDLIVSLNYSLIVFENMDRGRFVKRTRVNIHSWPTSIAAADYDNDGDLDLFICGYNPRGETAPGDIFANPVPYHDANNGARNFMMRNEGNWDFLDVTQAVGFDQNNRRFTFAATWEDYDNDGDADLYIANDFGRNILYRNDIDTTGERYFRDVSKEAGVEDIAAGMSVTWGDYNQDGWMDLYVSNMFSSAGSRITSQNQFKPDEDDQTRSDIQRHARGNSLFENQHDGTFRDVSVEAGVTLGRWAWGSTFADINNDGWEDLYVVNGFFTTPDTGDL